jgi:hypothetical protein
VHRPFTLLGMPVVVEHEDQVRHDTDPRTRQRDTVRA